MSWLGVLGVAAWLGVVLVGLALGRAAKRGEDQVERALADVRRRQREREEQL